MRRWLQYLRPEEGCYKELRTENEANLRIWQSREELDIRKDDWALEYCTLWWELHARPIKLRIGDRLVYKKITTAVMDLNQLLHTVADTKYSVPYHVQCSARFWELTSSPSSPDVNATSSISDKRGIKTPIAATVMASSQGNPYTYNDGLVLSSNLASVDIECALFS